MIHVIQQVEPNNFEQLVRQPGRRWLSQVPKPTSKQFSSRDYWTKVLKELHDAYSGICAYSCHWIPFDTGADTVEHFMPKVPYPQQAYEWSNYRLVCQTLNARKGTYDNLLDPFQTVTGWFWIDFPSLLVRPADSLDPAITTRVIDTRDRLGLNDEATCWKSRQRYVKDYCLNDISFHVLQRDAPFIASEVIRQGYVGTLNNLMGYTR